MPFVRLDGVFVEVDTSYLAYLLSCKDQYFFSKDGRPYSLDHFDSDINEGNNFETPIVVSHKLLGGKGGFGSMLRSMGSKMYKNRNKDACRGLDGRRIRDTTIEKKIKEHQEKAKDDDLEKPTKTQKERSKLEKYIIQDKSKNSSEDLKNAENYMENLKKSSNIIGDSVRSSIKQSTSTDKKDLRGHVGKRGLCKNNEKINKNKEVLSDVSDCSVESNLSLSDANEEIY